MEYVRELLSPYAARRDDLRVLFARSDFWSSIRKRVGNENVSIKMLKPDVI